MNRYDKIAIINTHKGKRYRSTVTYPLIEKNVADTYIIGMAGDRLDNLAYKYYGDVRLWWIIARANNIGKGDLNVPVGFQLRIPNDYSNIVDTYNKINS